jgi:hypothetical protein
MLYEGLAGQRPFQGPSALEIMNQHVYSAPTPLWVHRSEVPAEVAALVERLLTKQATERPTMRQLAEAAGRMGRRANSPGSANPSGTMTPPAMEALLAAPSSLSGPLSTADQIDSTKPLCRPNPNTPPAIPSLPFVVGPPIVEPRQFIGRQRELRRLGNLWRQPPLQNAALVGPRRAGTTSMMLTIKSASAGSPLRPGQKFEFLPPASTCQFIYTDFQDPRLGTVDGLLRHLLAGLRLPVPASCDLEGFMDAVAGRVTSPTVIMLDEIGVALERYRELDAAFWEGLRSLATSQTAGRIGFVLASHRPPHELAQQSLGGSPFFNIFGYCATLGPWSEEEARSLFTLSPLPIAEKDIVWMLERSQRWPVLLQILCRERLLASQDGEEGDSWRDEALRQLVPFSHLLHGND